MSVEERLLFLEQVVSILIADRNDCELDDTDEEILDKVFSEIYPEIPEI